MVCTSRSRADRGIPRENVGGVHPGNAVPDGPGCIYGAFRCSGGDRLPDGADPIPGKTSEYKNKIIDSYNTAEETLKEIQEKSVALEEINRSIKEISANIDILKSSVEKKSNEIDLIYKTITNINNNYDDELEKCTNFVNDSEQKISAIVFPFHFWTYKLHGRKFMKMSKKLQVTCKTLRQSH